jgi:hypothetical protein
MFTNIRILQRITNIRMTTDTNGYTNIRMTTNDNALFCHFF